jgi:hypothetical protein
LAEKGFINRKGLGPKRGLPVGERNHRRRRRRRRRGGFSPLSALNTFPSVYEVSPLTKGTKALRAGWRGRWWRRRGLLLLEGHRGVIGRVYHHRYEGRFGRTRRDSCDDRVDRNGDDRHDCYAGAWADPDNHLAVESGGEVRDVRHFY